MNGKIQVELQEWMGSDKSIANAAWTSTYDRDKRESKYDDEQKIAELVPRLIKEGHSTPVESVILRFWIRYPIFVDRQHMTHRIASHNGLSGRYRTMPEDWYSLPDDILEIEHKAFSKSSSDSILSEEFNTLCDIQHSWYKSQLNLFKNSEKDGRISNSEYKRVREVLRGILGTAFMVERTTILNLRSFANYQRLRNSEHAQKEIQTVAQMMLSEVESKGVAPVAVKALKEIGWKI